MLTFAHTQMSACVQHVAQITQQSDIMAITPDPTGRFLYAGLRSGVVTAWSLTSNALTAARTVLVGQGSVTNLAAPSSRELLVVRITGEVSLVTPPATRFGRSMVTSTRTTLTSDSLSIPRRASWPWRARRPRACLVARLANTLQGVSSQDLCPKFDGLDDESVETDFKQAHEDGEGRVMERQDALGACVFPKDVTALLWHPRITRQEEPAELGAFKDLYVGAGEWVYHFTWP